MGFTLIELLVVVAIVALLISILVPALGAARDTAKNATCMANLRGIGQACLTYAYDNQQQLPHYETMGRYGFRIAPGRKLGAPISGGGTVWIHAEVWGLQSVLHTGTEPRRLPNTMFVLVDTPRPIYYPMDSKAWICPANPGPSDRPDWPTWGNTYCYRTNSGFRDDPNDPNGANPANRVSASLVYNVDWLSTKRPGGGQNVMWINPIVWDNYKTYPGTPMFRGPFPGIKPIDEKFQRPPHRHRGISSKTPSQYWIAFYLDGHCGMNGLKK